MPNTNIEQTLKQFIIETVREAFGSMGAPENTGSAAIDEVGEDAGQEENRQPGDQGKVKHPESDKRLKGNR